MDKKKGLTWVGYVICIVLIVAAIFALLDIIKTFTAESGTIGFTTENKYFKTATEIDVKLTQTSLQLNEQTGFYEYSTTLKPVENYDGTKNKYELLVNNNICESNESGAGYLKSSYRLKVYDINGEVDVDDVIYINFQFFKNKTDIQIYTKGNSEVVSFWKSYIANEGFALKIIYGIR